MSSCCTKEPSGCSEEDKKKTDYLLFGSLTIIVLSIGLGFLLPDIQPLHKFAMSLTTFLKMMWWGIVFGILAVGVMSQIPRSYFQKLLGRGDTFGGLLRAAFAGLLLDMCSHGILMVGAKLYERGASIAQVMTFLIASPWNSISLTLILISLIGIKWTALFVLASVIIALITGVIFILLEKSGFIPKNPNQHISELSLNETNDKIDWQSFKTFKGLTNIIRDGVIEGQMVIRWLFVGTIIASLINAFVPTDFLQEYFGPTFIGLALTLIATSIIEVCSEGSAPIGAELITRAGAPGNAFTFLMAGVATDYTEIMVLRDVTKSWKITLLLPLLTVPQIVLLGWVMNQFGG